ncbi:MAG: hypothetical protein WA418_41720 [Bradyrhizobium sp.]
MAGSTGFPAGLAAAFTFLEGLDAPVLSILLPPLTSARFLHVHENRLHHLAKYVQIFILVKIGRNGAAGNGCHHDRQGAP